MLDFNKRENPYTGEVLYSAKHESGLGVYIIPKEEYSGTYAIFGTRYGSVDSEFIVPGETEAISVPDGIAHYLEHKMFDQPDGSNVFDKFSLYGGNANAFTSFNITAYLVSSTANFEENLATLLDYVQSPYYTDETVAKEQGIIGQEIRMYDDNPGWKLFFNYINCLYKEHPVKKEIAGTVESISEITADYLYKCYNTFYNLSNMSLVITGKVDIESAKTVIEAGIKNNEPFNEPIEKIYPEEPKEVASQYVEKSMAIASPMFMMGFKDNDVNLSGDALLKKDIEIRILMRMLFAKGSDIYKKLYDENLINSTFSLDYTLQLDYGFTSLDGESKDPKKVYETILSEFEKIRETGLSEDVYDRAKKVIWGRYIRTHNDIEDLATTFMQYLFMGVDYFNYRDVYQSITFDDIKKRFEGHFKPQYSALSVVNPL
ncbi:MAG: insulinase family protein [Clostridia bacterium]|nr:insulinase family protein [Clostridia bacterium]